MSASQGRDSGTWASEQLNADKPRQQAKQSRQAALWRTWPLLWVIAAWAAIAFALFITVGLLIWWLFVNDPQTPGADLFVGENGADPLKFLQIILAIVGGVGAVGYLVIKYRERSDAESSKADQRLLEAVTQLGSDSPQVRIAGVYALADIADTFQGSYKQRVVDILCGYLRADRSDGDVQQPDASTPTRFRDAAVESTILSVIASHVHKKVDSVKSWSECDFDVHRAVLHEDIPFADTIWKGAFNAERIRFVGKAFFNRASFGDRVDFSGVEFGDEVLFDGASFGDMGVFRGAKFLDQAVFNRVSFGNSADFKEASFLGRTFFRRATFGDSAFLSRTSYDAEAFFNHASFGDWTDFSGATFSNRASFSGASFGDLADFSEASFGDGVNFGGTRYGRDSLLTPIQQEWLRREIAEEQQDVQGEGTTAQEPSNESGADNAQRDDADPAAEETPGESGAADEKSTDNN